MKAATKTPPVQVRRLIPAPRDRVFAAWVDPDTLARWFAPGQLVATVEQLDVKAGGGYRISMRDDSDAVHTVLGVFTQVEPQQRLRMSWRWEDEPEEVSQVTVDFLDRTEGTEVRVHHEQLSEEAVALHKEGWTSCLGNLTELSEEWPS